jgi:hypothetical protein
LHELVDVDPFIQRPGPVVMTVDAEVEGGARVAEAFLGAVALVRNFLADPNGTPVTPRIAIAFRGNESHRRLTSGEMNGKNAGKNIVFVCVRPSADLGDYASVIGRQDKWPLVLFCCGSAEQERALRPGVRSVTVRPRTDRLEALQQAIAAIDVRVDPVQVDFRK